MNEGLRPLLAPESVAIIGASTDFSRIGGMLVKYLLKFGYKGRVYPVNPKYEEIASLRCYPSVAALPEKADTALVAVPEKFILDTITDCARAGVKSAIVYSAGFAETGEEGKAKQEKLSRIIKEAGMKVCGPNCIGIINFRQNAAMSFSGFMEADRLVPGNIGFVSQSGALGGTILSRAQDRNIGFSHFVSTGNEAELDLVDFMDFMVDDPETTVIMAYVEGIRDPAKFAALSRRALEKGKPIVVLKVGETESGKRVAASHTGSLTGSDSAYSAAFRQHGVVRVEDYDDLIETAMLFSKSKLPRGNRIGILTSSGGGAIILADKFTKHGMALPDLTDSTKQQLSQKIVSFATIGNPMDLTGQLYSEPEIFKRVIELFARDENIDIVMTVISMVPKERARARATWIIEAAQAIDKPFVTWWAAGSLSEPGMALLDESQVPLFKSPERCVKALKSMVEYLGFRDRLLTSGQAASAPETAERDRARGILQASPVLTEHQAKQLLACYGIPITQEEVAKSAEQAAEIAARIGRPVALKVSSPQIAHKTEAGGIRLNISGKAAVPGAYNDIMTASRRYAPQADIEGVLVQEMAGEGTEVIVGVARDATFGPMIMFGLGGIMVEVLKDVSLRPLPITRRDAVEMLAEIKGSPILKGVRGRPPADTETIIDILLKISSLVADLGDDIAEIDLNPIIVFEQGKGARVVDALVIKKGA
ncbi:MAG: acetate--CoA ligase family protein [Chloroflexi bacterium]|nr:acetate--CoA ligase family protein [Chloroflexota bacterium]